MTPADLRATCNQALRVQQARYWHEWGLPLLADTLYRWGGFEVEVQHVRNNGTWKGGPS